MVGLRDALGIHSTGVHIEEVESPKARSPTRRRVKWYASLVNFRDIAVAALEGITNA